MDLKCDGVLLAQFGLQFYVAVWQRHAPVGARLTVKRAGVAPPQCATGVYCGGVAPSWFSCSHAVTVWQRHNRRGGDTWRCRTVTIENVTVRKPRTLCRASTRRGHSLAALSSRQRDYD